MIRFKSRLELGIVAHGTVAGDRQVHFRMDRLPRVSNAPPPPVKLLDRGTEL